MDIEIIGFVILIILLAFSFGGLTIKWHHDFRLKQERIRAESKGSSLATSELSDLIQSAMLDALSPLEERLDLIEMHMRQLPEHAAEKKALDRSESVDSRED